MTQLPRPSGSNLMKRRTFIASAATAGASVLTATSWARVPGANSDLRVGVVGLHGIGRRHIGSFAALKGVRVVALCDVDSAVLAKASAQAKSLGQTVRAFEDYRDMLAQKDVDAVCIATPNHQHALQGIWALQAGKDLFLEKPVSHDLWEGKQLLAAEQKFGRVVQANIQSRSSQAIAEALAYVKSGALGKVQLVRGLCYKRRASIGKTQGPQPIPDSINYDLWLGPLAKGPLRRSRLHYDWHWQWATGNGDIANQGNHQMDVGRRFLEDSWPSRVESVGGRLGYDDDGETHNTVVTVLHYATAPFVFEVRGLPKTVKTEQMDQLKGISVGNIVECEGGYIVIPARGPNAQDRSLPDYALAVAYDLKGRELRRFTGRHNHYANFVSAVKSGKKSDLACPLSAAVTSSALSHLPNMSLRTGTDHPLGWFQRELPTNALYREAVERMNQHLASNGLPKDAVLRQGASLAINTTTNRFEGKNTAELTTLSKSSYRAPFVIPNLD